MVIHPPLQNFYESVMSTLEAAGVPFLVGGAFALHAYTGIARDTKDFDLMMRQADLERGLRALRQAGYGAEVVFGHWLAKVHRGESFVDIIFNSGNGLCRVDDEWFEHCTEAQLWGREVHLCAPEEMIWQKAFIQERERFDGADIVHLLECCGAAMDWERLLARFGPDWPVLMAHLVLFDFIYPDRREVVPASVKERLRRQWSELRVEEGNCCNGPLLSREQYLDDVERRGLRDPRLSGPRAMRPEYVRAWTSAIEKGHG